MTINGKRIDAMLAEREMTKKALSAACGISAPNISTIINRGTCTPTTAGKIAKGLGVPVSDILEVAK